MKSANRASRSAAQESVKTERVGNARIVKRRQLIYDPNLPATRGHLSVSDRLDTYKRSYYYVRGNRVRTLTPTEAWRYIINRWMPAHFRDDLLRFIPQLVEWERTRQERRRSKHRRMLARWRKEGKGKGGV